MIMLFLMALAAAPQGAKPPAQTLSCDYPVKANDTAKSLLARYKGAEVSDDVYIADSQVRGVRLFPGVEGREIDVTFADDKMTQVEFVITVDNSTWRGPKGLHLGSPMAEVITANGGKPLTIRGFDWDYGGWIVETHGGPMHDLAGKDCYFGVQLEITSDTMGDEVYQIGGEGVHLSSSNPIVVKARPAVSEMSLTFGVKK